VVEADPPSASCRAAVAKRHDSPRQAIFDGSGRAVVVTDSDPCGLVIDNVYFKRDDAAIRQPEIVDEVAGMLSCLDQVEHVRFRLDIVGHTSADERDRQALGLARAHAVERYMTACGVPLLGIQARAADAAGSPAAESESELERDRRVEFLIIRRETR
jgi:outer membrane protein OmpA-like peptidoglycan-associated protein